MMRLLVMVTLVATLSGCAVLQTTGEILDILVPDEPTPVCDSQSAGVTVDGLQCVKYSDGSYSWR